MQPTCVTQFAWMSIASRSGPTDEFVFLFRFQKGSLESHVVVDALKRMWKSEG